MLWQDIVLSIINIGFVIALIPQLIKVQKTKSAADFAWTSIIFYCFGLFAIGTVFITLNFYLTSIPYFVTGLMWGVIVMKKMQYEKK
jgi:uncharacterized protein with PQ loop repeat